MQEWVEVRGPTVEEAVQAGLDELGIGSIDEAEIEVIQEPKRRFLFRVQDAVVRIKSKPAKKKRRRRRRKGGDGGGNGEQRSSGQRQSGGKGGGQRGGQKGGERGGQPSGQQGRQQRQRSGDDGGQARSGGRSEKRPSGKSDRGDGARAAKQQRPAQRDHHEGGSVATDSTQATQESAPPKPEPAEQAEIAASFLRGLLDAFGLEGNVDSRVDEGVIFIDVTGEQTEALVGPKGAIMQAILELTRTVVQRKTFGGARMRLDIAGYATRRQEALQIYAARLADQVKQDGEEVMLEPMNPADRKVVHDAITEIEGVRTYSEGEEPNRSVIISLAPGATPSGSTMEADEAGDDAPDDAPDGDGESE